MRRLLHLARAGGVAWALALLGFFTPSALSYAPLAAPPQAILAGGIEYARIGGAIRLAANAPPAPAAYGSFQRFGSFISPARRFDTAFHTLRIAYSTTQPRGSAVRLDVRASPDGRRWSEWEVGLRDGALATFPTPARFAQYRATLLGNRASPTLGNVILTPEPLVAAPKAGPAIQSIAPTYRVHATRMGMVGGRTANGHRITKRDRFVALPSWRSLSSKGGDEYRVRISYNGRSAIAPVYDVGPWNLHDNYWDEQRERFGDLPRGWPEDHAAYFDGYNGGRAEKGRVRFPTAVDVGDGVWWDDLGIRGDRAEVEVTFLWLGDDPAVAAPPPPAPVAAPSGEIVVEESGPGFHAQPATWYRSPWRCGSGGHALWTFTTTDAAASENVARWQPALPHEALYDLYAFVPACVNGHADTSGARYLVYHRDGAQEVAVDQASAAGSWVLLGRFPFAAGEAGYVELRDVASDSMRSLWYDAIKWVRISETNTAQ